MNHGRSSGTEVWLGGRERQLHGWPVLPALLSDFREVGHGKPLPLQAQLVDRPPGRAVDVVGDLENHLDLGALHLESRPDFDDLGQPRWPGFGT